MGPSSAEIKKFLKSVLPPRPIKRTSKKFVELFKLLKKDIKKHGAVDNEVLLYFPDKYKITLKQFQTIFRALEDLKWNENKKCSFPNQELIWGGLYFFMMSGQGTYMSVCDAKNIH